MELCLLLCWVVETCGVLRLFSATYLAAQRKSFDVIPPLPRIVSTADLAEHLFCVLENNHAVL